jgi:hypothetical protein
MGCASKGTNPLESLPIIPIPNQHEIQLGGLRSGEEFENAQSQNLKCVERPMNKLLFHGSHRYLFLSNIHPNCLFVPYMLKKYD